METAANDLIYKGNTLTIDFDPKKQKGLIQLPESASLKTVIELLNDCNLSISGDEKLNEKWKDMMPNGSYPS